MKLLRILKDAYSSVLSKSDEVDKTTPQTNDDFEYVAESLDEFENMLFLLKRELRNDKFIMRKLVRIHEVHELPCKDFIDFIYRTEMWFQNYKSGIDTIFKPLYQSNTILQYYYINSKTNTYVDVGEVVLKSIEMWERINKSSVFDTPAKKDFYLKNLKEDWRKVYELIYDLIYN